jgi:uncharacterized membrane protein
MPYDPAMPKKTPETSWTTHRISGLMDGVFAIAMTLLVFNLKIPAVPGNAPAGALGKELWAQLPQFLSFGLSLLVLGVYWVAYTILFHLLQRTDRLYHWVCLIYVLCVICVPFSANLISQYPGRLEAVLFYGFNLVACSAALYLNYWYAMSRNLMGPKAHPVALQALKRRILIGTGIYLAATLLAFIDTRISLTIFVLISLFYIVPPKSDNFLKQ